MFSLLSIITLTPTNVILSNQNTDNQPIFIIFASVFCFGLFIILVLLGVDRYNGRENIKTSSNNKKDSDIKIFSYIERKGCFDWVEEEGWVEIKKNNKFIIRNRNLPSDIITNLKYINSNKQFLCPSTISHQFDILIEKLNQNDISNLNISYSTLREKINKTIALIEESKFKDIVLFLRTNFKVAKYLSGEFEVINEIKSTTETSIRDCYRNNYPYYKIYYEWGLDMLDFIKGYSNVDYLLPFIKEMREGIFTLFNCIINEYEKWKKAKEDEINIIIDMIGNEN